jgi:hypothetical protein
MIGAAHAGGVMVIQHKVSNYTNWRPAFDADKANQEAAGLTNPHVYQSVDSANEVTITFDMADANKAKAFGSSKALKETMVKAGVVGKPALSYLNPAQ